MITNDFNFDLPKNLIAQDPVEPRDQCKLMIYDSSRDRVYHEKFCDIASYLSPKDLIVLNRSRVIPARIRFEENGRKREIFVLNFLGGNLYEVLVKPGKVFKLGKCFFINKNLNFKVREIKENGHRIVECNLSEKELEFELELSGEVPLPPYIKRTCSGFEHYQTVFAKEKGSVAAPTAGLHFTQGLLDTLVKNGVEIEEVLLHVGLGTFLPVTSENLKDHVMHGEVFSLSDNAARSLNLAFEKGKRIIAVGTTSVRVLETCFDDGFKPCDGKTDIFIYPGNYKWKIVDAIITNFHLPKSTLLMLVASFLEEKGIRFPVRKILELYDLAIKNKYRFYSFGDAMFIF